MTCTRHLGHSPHGCFQMPWPGILTRWASQTALVRADLAPYLLFSLCARIRLASQQESDQEPACFMDSSCLIRDPGVASDVKFRKTFISNLVGLHVPERTLYFDSDRTIMRKLGGAGGSNNICSVRSIGLWHPLTQGNLTSTRKKHCKLWSQNQLRGTTWPSPTETSHKLVGGPPDRDAGSGTGAKADGRGGEAWNWIISLAGLADH